MSLKFVYLIDIEYLVIHALIFVQELETFVFHYTVSRRVECHVSRLIKTIPIRQDPPAAERRYLRQPWPGRQH